MGSMTLANLILKRLEYGDNWGSFEVASWMHRRSLFITDGDVVCLSFKGVGWVHGPPWVFYSPKDDELCFGLLDRLAGQREMAVSERLQQYGCDTSVCVACVTLLPSDLDQLGVHAKPIFKSGRCIDPVVLVTRSKSPLRVCDHTPARLLEWRKTLGKYFTHSKLLIPTNSHEAIAAFACHLAETIIRYQKRGAVNDTLSADNVTIAGEVTDFEWFYVPGIPLPDGSTDTILFERQKKEAFYFVDVIISLCDGLNIRISISEIVGYVFARGIARSISKCGFEQQMFEFLEVKVSVEA